jgi:hypothetical protein
MSVPTQAQYEADELDIARRDEERINREPLRDRRECQASYLDAMRTDPATVAERIAWLIEGNYGKGPQLLAARIVSNPRLNRVACLAQLVCVYEWRCPRVMGREAWKKLTKSQQATLARVIEVVIEDAIRSPTY